jgi:hypothetical protein
MAEAAVTAEQLELLDDVSKLASISYCEIKPPFRCNPCSEFQNTTLIKVAIPSAMAYLTTAILNQRLFRS